MVYICPFMHRGDTLNQSFDNQRFFELQHENQSLHAQIQELQQIISERDSIQAKALTELSRLKKAIETIEVGVTITSLDGIIEYVNPTLARMHNYQPEDLVGKHAIMLAKPNSRKLVSISDLEQMETWVRERENITSDGRVFPVQLISTPISDLEGRPAGIITITEDITHRKKAENDLKKSESELRELNLAKDKFISILAHDLRNVFNTLLMSTELLSQYASELSEAERNETMKDLYQASRNGYSLLQNLLDWSMSMKGKSSFMPRTFDLIEQVRESLRLSDSAARAKYITISSQIQPGLEVYADPNMVATIFRNLLSNAIKFTPENGTINITANSQGDFVEISVKDSGTGISKENIERILSPGLTLTLPGTNQEKGNGLGLTLVREFVELHHGVLRIQSQAGQGSTFSFTLPVRNLLEPILFEI